MAYSKTAIKETIKDVWEEPDGSDAYSTKKEEVEVYFKNHNEYINKVLVKVLNDFYDGKINFDKTTALQLLWDFDEIEETIEKEFEYEINDILLDYYYEQIKR